MILDLNSPVHSIPLETAKSQIAFFSNSTKNSRSTKKSKYPEKIITPINSESHKNKNISLELNTLNSELIPSFLPSNRSNVNTGNNSIPSCFGTT